VYRDDPGLAGNLLAVACRSLQLSGGSAQRISEHAASKVIELTPRVWKTMFADHPMKSDLALAEQ